MKSSTAPKVSISLPADLLDFVEEYRLAHQAASRSEVFAEALRLLRKRELARAYAQASREWDESEDAKLWEQTAGDGL
jgi:antitoxin ParD1/3/4